MKQNSAYLNSVIKKILDFFFYDKKILFLNDTFLGNWTSTLKVSHVAEVTIISAILIYWYEGARVFPDFLKASAIPLIIILFGLIFFNKKVSIRKIHIHYFLFLLAASFSAFMAILNGYDLKMIISGWMLFAMFILVVLLSQSIVRKFTILKALVFVSLPLSLVGIFQYIAKVDTSNLWLSSLDSDIGTRAFAFFGSPNVLGGVLALVLIISVAIFIKEKKNLYFFIAFITFIAEIFTFSRTFWISLIAVLIFTSIVYYKKLIYLFALVPLFFLFENPVKKRLSVLFFPEYWQDAALDGRVWAIINGLHIFKQNPVFGTGPGSYGGLLAIQNASPVYLQSIQSGYTALYYTDNQFLEILVQTGIFGIVTFLFFCVAVLTFFVRSFRNKDDIMTLAIAACFICFLVFGMFSNVMEFAAVSLFMAVLIGLGINGKEKNSDSL